jgi:hypothetical protein
MLADASVAELRESLDAAYSFYSSSSDSSLATRGELALAGISVAVIMRATGRADLGTPEEVAGDRGLSVPGPSEHRWGFVNGKARFVFEKGEFPVYDLAAERNARFKSGEPIEPVSIIDRQAYEELYAEASRLLD